MADALFSTIARIQGDRPWGRVLDAGTGEHSLRWLRSLETTAVTALTGDPAREHDLTRRLASLLRPADRVLTGNWTDPLLLHGEVYDTVLADYLLGAVDGFAPYFQGELFGRLRRHVGQRLYVVGQEPYPGAETEGGRLVWEIARLRDACILLAGHRCYREYPRDWVVRSLEAAGFAVDEVVSIPIVYRARFVDGQLDVCRRKLAYFDDSALAAVMQAHIEDLRARAKAVCARDGGIPFGEDYVVAARPTGT